MKRVLVTAEFMLRDKNGLWEMTEQELATEVQGLFDNEECGIAEYGSAAVMALWARKE